MIQTEKKTLLSMIGTSAIIMVIGFYVGLVLKDIILLGATLIVIELFIGFIAEITGQIIRRSKIER